MYTYAFVCISHKRIKPGICANTNTYIYAYKCIHVCIRMHTYIHTNAYMYAYKCIHVFIQMHTCIHTNAYMYSYKCIHVFIQIHSTCIHKYAYMYPHARISYIFFSFQKLVCMYKYTRLHVCIHSWCACWESNPQSSYLRLQSFPRQRSSHSHSPFVVHLPWLEHTIQPS